MCVEVGEGDMHPCPPVYIRCLQKFQVFKIHFTEMLKAFSFCFSNTKYIAKKIIEDSRFGNNAYNLLVPSDPLKRELTVLCFFGIFIIDPDQMPRKPK